MRGKVIYGKFGKPHRYFLNDVEVSEAAFDEAFPRRTIGRTGTSCSPSCWPLRSRALAVHPRQVEQANRRNKRMGLHTYYDRDGTAVIPDRGERKRLLKQELIHDNDGGYGD